MDIDGDSMDEDIDVEEEQAHHELSSENLAILNKGLRYYLSNPTRKDVEMIITENLATVLEYAPKIKSSGYYEDQPEKLREALILLQQILTYPNLDKHFRETVEDSIEAIKKLLKTISPDYYEEYVKPYVEYPYYAKYPYPYTYKKKTPREIEQEELSKLINNIQQREEDELREDIKRNLLADLVFKGYPFMENKASFAEQVEWYKTEANLDKMVLDICREIRELKQRQELERKQWLELEQRKEELEKSKRKAKETLNKLLDRCIDELCKEYQK